MIVPTGIGRIPFKIINGFAGFKADQFKNWVNIYSIPSLFGIFETDHLECWRHFVLASRILCKHNLTVNDVNLADALLLQFCKRVQRMYGENVITPNMHLHCHLKDVLLDYGPSHEFWLFPYERYNGTMGNFPTNNRNFEPQLMQRFVRDLSSSSFPFPSEFQDDFNSIRQLVSTNTLSGSLLDTEIDYCILTSLLPATLYVHPRGSKSSKSL